MSKFQNLKKKSWKIAQFGDFFVENGKKYDLGLIKKFLKPGLFKNIFFENKYIFTFKDNILALLH